MLLTLINIRGVRPGAWTQNVFTVLKLAAIAALVIAAFVAPRPCRRDGARSAARTGRVVLALGAALVPVLFAFGGWQQTNFIAEELIDPERNLPRALVIGVLAVVAAYLLVNVAYIRALGIGGLAASSAPAADTMGVVAGDVGRRLIGAGIVASTFGFLNLVILVSPRVYQAMARDGLFFRSFARLHPTWRTPVAAIVLQGVWAILLLFSKKYGDLLDYVVFGDWIFFGLNARRRCSSCGATTATARCRSGRRCIRGRRCSSSRPPVYVVVGSVASNPRNAHLGKRHSCSPACRSSSSGAASAPRGA